jgi:hypothetical protein
MNALMYLHRNLSNFLFDSLIASNGVGEAGVVTQTATSCGLYEEAILSKDVRGNFLTKEK